MADYVEKWGDDIESAVELALRDIKLSRDEVEIEVLEQPTRGFLGFHKKLAKVRVTKKTEPVPEPTVPEEPVKPAEKPVESVSVQTEKNRKSKDAPAKEKKQNRENDRPKFEKHFERAEVITDEEPEPVREENRESRRQKKDYGKKSQKESLLNTKFTVTEEDTEAIPANDAPGVEFIRRIAENMGLNIEVKGNIIDDALYIEMSGREVGALIGKRGQTLDSVQYLASIVQNKESDRHLRVLVNAEKYREKREKTLQQLARKVADKCVKTGRNQKLEAMNPYERKVIHSALQSHPKVTTKSEGVEPTRRVVVELKK